ncbi:MAG: HlyD family efflux transporter periplasmic adaptor subunit, partial [Pirellulaceae bacterium]|nr:HlyD family efflux transporter periplasmic adaptor subunit [Pirellulaceae bacterium]
MPACTPSPVSLRSRPSWSARRHASARRGSSVLFVLAVLVVLALIVTAIIVFFVRSGDDEGEVPLTVQPVRGVYEHIVLERGEVESSNNVEVKCLVKSLSGSSNTSTKILSIVPEGTFVNEGEWLITFDSASLEQEARQQRINVLTSEALVIQAKAVYDTAVISKKEYLEATYLQEERTIQNEIFLAEQKLRDAETAYESTEGSVARGFLIPLQLEGEKFRVEAARNERDLALSKLQVLAKYTKEKMLTQLDSDIEAARVKWQNEQESLTEERKKLQEIEDQIKNCEVVAPTSGQVVYANVRSSRSGSEFIVEEGAQVRQGQVLIRLPDPKQMQVKTNINESRINLVQVGMPVTIRIDAFGEGGLAGEVMKVNEYPEPGNWWSSTAKQYATVVRILNPPPEIKSGLTAEVRIHVQHLDDALQIPVQALYEHKGQTFCLVQQGEKQFETRRVVMQSTNDKMVAIDTQASDPLDPAELVVINPRQHSEKFDFAKFTDLPSDEEWAARGGAGRARASGPAGAAETGSGPGGAPLA